MLLRMPSPMKRPQSTSFQFRRRIPRDVLDEARGQTIRVPVGDRMVEKKLSAKAVEVGFSLDTRDPAEAKTREALAIAHLDLVWEAMRHGPRSLTKREAVALSGELYRDWFEAAGDDPGSPELWGEINAVNEMAMAGDWGITQFMIGEKAKKRHALELRFGRFAEAILQRHGLIVDKESRLLLIEECAKAMVQVSEQLGRHADSDFRPDPNADRFPTKPEAKRKPEPVAPASLPFDELVEKRWRDAEVAGGSHRTLSAWKSAVKHLTTFLGHDDAAKVTKTDVVAFKDHRVAAGISVKTINDSDLAALKSLFSWAVTNGYLASNPAEGVKIKQGRAAKKQPERAKSLTDEEAMAILRYARTRKPSAREGEKTAAGRRWVPWVLAFTGARAGEIVQLRRKDVFEKDGRWVIRITPEAGSVKTGIARIVPLHLQLIEDGFIDFVQAAPAGHLFVSPENPARPQGVVTGLTNRLRREIRTVVADQHVQPMHGWRHRFATQCRNLGLSGDTARAIEGHAPRDQHGGYGEDSVEAMARVIDALPRYCV